MYCMHGTMKGKNSYLCTYDLCPVHNVLDAGISITRAFPGPNPLSLAQVCTCSISKREEKGELYVAVSAVWRGMQDPNKMTEKKIWHLPSWMSCVLCAAEVAVLFSFRKFFSLSVRSHYLAKDHCLQSNICLACCSFYLHSNSGMGHKIAAQ
jgi:hypothetical protein